MRMRMRLHVRPYATRSGCMDMRVRTRLKRSCPTTTRAFPYSTTNQRPHDTPPPPLPACAPNNQSNTLPGGRARLGRGPVPPPVEAGPLAQGRGLSRCRGRPRAPPTPTFPAGGGGRRHVTGSLRADPRRIIRGRRRGWCYCWGSHDGRFFSGGVSPPHGREGCVVGLPGCVREARRDEAGERGKCWWWWWWLLLLVVVVIGYVVVVVAVVGGDGCKLLLLLADVLALLLQLLWFVVVDGIGIGGGGGESSESNGLFQKPVHAPSSKAW